MNRWIDRGMEDPRVCGDLLHRALPLVLRQSGELELQFSTAKNAERNFHWEDSACLPTGSVQFRSDQISLSATLPLLTWSMVKSHYISL